MHRDALCELLDLFEALISPVDSEMCRAQDVGDGLRDGFHSHKCPRCETEWQHSNLCAGDDTAHQCPECGTEQRFKHRF